MVHIWTFSSRFDQKTHFKWKHITRIIYLRIIYLHNKIQTISINVY